MKHYTLYHEDLPPLLRDLAQTPALQRLKQIGMNCGCEYTHFPRFTGLAPYSRFDHSLGVGLIVWHFTRDAAQAAAGLLHDISTPAFAHVVDFLNGDYLTQESTESDTRSVILSSRELCSVLQAYSLTAEQVCDYHQYPIADNDTPRLSADRLEYTVGNSLNFGFCDLSAARALYDDLTVGENESGQPELVFRTPAQALRFAELSLSCSKVYVSDEDRFSMEALSRVLRDAILRGVLTREDLMKTEETVINKLLSDKDSSAAWRHFCGYHTLFTAGCPREDRFCCRVDAKKRHIDPLIAGQGRVTAVFTTYREALSRYLQDDFDRWLWARLETDETDEKRLDFATVL